MPLHTDDKSRQCRTNNCSCPICRIISYKVHPPNISRPLMNAQLSTSIRRLCANVLRSHIYKQYFIFSHISLRRKSSVLKLPNLDTHIIMKGLFHCAKEILPTSIYCSVVLIPWVDIVVIINMVLHNPPGHVPPDTYPQDIYTPRTLTLWTLNYLPDTYPLVHIPPWTYTPWTEYLLNK